MKIIKCPFVMPLIHNTLTQVLPFGFDKDYFIANSENKLDNLQKNFLQ